MSEPTEAVDAATEEPPKEEEAAEGKAEEEGAATAAGTIEKDETPKEEQQDTTGTPPTATAAPAAEPQQPETQQPAVKEEDVEMKEASPPAAEGEEKQKKKRKKSSPAEAAAPPAVKRERRERKSAEAFTPDDFLHVDKSIRVTEGRGKALGDLPAVVESFENETSTSAALQLLHRLLYAQRGKPPKKDVKPNLLAFSGYLPAKDEELDKKAQEAVDEEHEVGGLGLSRSSVCLLVAWKPAVFRKKALSNHAITLFCFTHPDTGQDGHQSLQAPSSPAQNASRRAGCRSIGDPEEG